MHSIILGTNLGRTLGWLLGIDLESLPGIIIIGGDAKYWVQDHKIDGTRIYHHQVYDCVVYQDVFAVFENNKSTPIDKRASVPPGPAQPDPTISSYWQHPPLVTINLGQIKVFLTTQDS